MHILYITQKLYSFLNLDFNFLIELLVIREIRNLSRQNY